MNKNVRSILGLATADIKVLKLIVINCPKVYDTNDLMSLLSLNKTTVQRAVKKLRELNLIKHKQINLNGGGYVFNYYVESRQLVKVQKNLLLQAFTDEQREEEDWL